MSAGMRPMLGALILTASGSLGDIIRNVTLLSPIVLEMVTYFSRKGKKNILELQCSETSFSVAKGQQGRKQTHSWHSPEHSVPQTQSQAIAKPHIIETQLTLYVCILFNKLFLRKKQRGTQNGIFIQEKNILCPFLFVGFNTYTQSVVIIFTPLPSGIPTPSL